MLWHQELYARRCVKGLIEIVEQVPIRAAARGLMVFDRSSVAMLTLWTMLRWELTPLLTCLADMGVDMWGLTRELDALIEGQKPGENLSDGSITMAGTRFSLFPQELDRHLSGLLDRAQARARTLQHDHLGPEHLLLAIIEGADDRLTALLSRHGITHETVERAVFGLLQRGQRTGYPLDTRPVRPVRPWTGPKGARWDTEAVGVPRRFGMAVLMLLMTMYAVLFATMQMLDANPIVFTVIAILFTGVGLGQILLFGGKYPRAASVWVGACLFPVEVIVAWIYMAHFASHRLHGGPQSEEMLCFLIFSIPLGAGLGYLAGGLTAGVFFLIETLRKRRED